MNTKVLGIFKLPDEGERKPLSCLIIQRVDDHRFSTSRIFTKWAVQKIEHLDELLRSSQSVIGAQRRNSQRCQIPVPDRNLEFADPEQYHPYCGRLTDTRLRPCAGQHISDFLYQEESIQGRLNYYLLQCASKSECNFYLRLKTYEKQFGAVTITKVLRCCVPEK
jgi:hypothetical protein